MRLHAVIASTGLTLALVSCGGDRAPRNEAVALTGLTAANDSGLKVTAISTKERAKALYITLTLVNGSEKTILFRNPESDRVPGFKIAADGREPQGADAGKMQATKSRASRLHDLAPGAEAEMEVKWTFEPPLAHESYPWTLTIANLFVNDQKVSDVTLSYTPGTAK